MTRPAPMEAANGRSPRRDLAGAKSPPPPPRRAARNLSPRPCAACFTRRTSVTSRVNSFRPHGTGALDRAPPVTASEKRTACAMSPADVSAPATPGRACLRDSIQSAATLTAAESASDMSGAPTSTPRQFGAARGHLPPASGVRVAEVSPLTNRRRLLARGAAKLCLDRVAHRRGITGSRAGCSRGPRRQARVSAPAGRRRRLGGG
jgi:hypothetical protein